MKRGLAAGLALATALALLFTTGPGRVYACSCAIFDANEQRVQHRLDSSYAIVIGTLSSLPRLDAASSLNTFAIDVDTEYKGPGAERLVFSTPSNGEACGYEYADERGRHLVELHADRAGRLHTDTCSAAPMSLIDGDPATGGPFDADLAMLGKLAPPRHITQANDTSPIVVGLYLAGSLVFIAALVAVGRRRAG